MDDQLGCRAVRLLHDAFWPRMEGQFQVPAMDEQADTIGALSGLVDNAAGSAEKTKDATSKLTARAVEVEGNSKVMLQQGETLDGGIRALLREVAAFVDLLKVAQEGGVDATDRTRNGACPEWRPRGATSPT